MNWTEGVTLGIALLGAVLGVINTMHALGRDRVRLKVSPVWGMYDYGSHLSETRLGISVVNLSGFPLTIDDVGFVRWRWKGKRVAVILPDLPDGKPWPRSLAPHDSATVWCPEGIENTSEMLEVRKAYAKTTSGIVRYGKGPAIQSFVRFRRRKEDEP
jgi:hypothetical protein